MKNLPIFLLCLPFIHAKLNTEWWKYTNIYELLVATYKDSDGDGIGDFQGIISKLDHLHDLGVETIQLLPMYETNYKDMGYDVKNYYEVNPMYGTMEDFHLLIKELKARGMKLILDLVINHSSNEHEWFIKSVKRIEPYTDYYVWEDPVYDSDGYLNPPNSWGGVFGSGCWTYNEERGQYYYHVFLAEQPDLNLRNSNVRRELMEMMTFWLDKGIAGFRTDAPMVYIEDKYLRDDGEDRILNQKESFEFMHEIREFFDKYNKLHGGYERFLAPEPHAEPELGLDYLGTKEYPVNHFIFNYYFEYQKSELTATNIEVILQSWLSSLPVGARVGWVIQDHDQSRTGTRIGENYMDILTITTALVPGVLHLYYGQEIGLMDCVVLSSQIRDLSGGGARDPNRLLMQWDDSTSAGFSSNLTTFSPMCMDYMTRNVKTQKREKISHYNLLKSLLALRKTKTVKYGHFNSHIYSPFVYIFWRSFHKQPTIIVILNLDTENSEIGIKEVLHDLPKTLTVVAASVNSGFQNGDTVGYRDKYKFIMKPQSGVVFSTKDDIKKHSYDSEETSSEEESR